MSRPLRELRESEVIRQDKTRGPYRVDEKVAEDLYRLRSIKGEFDRDEVAKRKAQDQRRFFAYELKLGDTILHLIEDGSNPDHALRLAKDLVPPPTGIDEYQLGKHQEWAFNRAKKEQRRFEAKNEDVRKGAA